MVGADMFSFFREILKNRKKNSDESSKALAHKKVSLTLKGPTFKKILKRIKKKNF
jgi:hypothetical protein